MDEENTRMCEQIQRELQRIFPAVICEKKNEQLMQELETLARIQLEEYEYTDSDVLERLVSSRNQFSFAKRTRWDDLVNRLRVLSEVGFSYPTSYHLTEDFYPF